MQIKVITRHSPSNYGSLLQSIATLRILSEMGFDAELLDYIRKDDLGLCKVWTEAKIKYNNLLKKFLYCSIRYPIEKYAEIQFAKMRKSYLRTTAQLSSWTNLEKENADVFMTGSDQVWGPMVDGKYDPAYFLQFVKKGKKISYAASFGRTKFDDEIVAAYQQMLAKYDCITIREESAKHLLESWRIKNSFGMVLDPTLLLKGEQWRQFANIDTKCQKKYILVYQLHNDNKLSFFAKNLAKKTGMDLIRVNPFLHQIVRCGRFVCCPDAKNFIKLIDESSLMVTDSFHGTCFAINLNKQFIEFLPNNSTGTRNQSLLALTKLTNRIVSDYDDFSILNDVIDYENVNQIIAKERTKSMHVLKQMLTD